MPRPKSPSKRRQELEDELACVTLEAQVEVTKQARSLVESGWGEIVPSHEYSRTFDDEPNARRYGRNIWHTHIRDRANGDCIPIYETEQELAAIRAEGRLLSMFASVGCGAMESLKNYVIGTGFDVEVQCDDKSLCQDVQRFVDTFLDDNRFTGVMDREIHERGRVDGEPIIALYPGNRVPRADVMEPDWLTQPLDTRELSEWVEEKYGVQGPHYWKYGVHTVRNPHMQREDTTNPVGYHFFFGDEYDYIPASRVVHLKRNVPMRCKRGVSDFVGIWEELYDDKTLGRNLTKGAAIQAAIAFFRQHPVGASKTGIESMVASNATNDYQQQRNTTSGASTRTRKVEKFLPGTVKDMPAGMEYKASALGQPHSDIFIRVSQAVQRRIGVRWQMSEGFISGDYSNNAFASQLIAEGPFVKAREADQSDEKRILRELLWKALRMHFDAGRLARHGIEWEQMESVVELVVNAPAVATRDKYQQAQTAAIEISAGILSRRTAATEAGRDYDEEIEAGAEPAGLPPGQITATTGLPTDQEPLPTSTTGESPATDAALSTQQIQTSEDLVLNGAQITAATGIVTAVAKGELPRDSGLGQLKILFNLSDVQADAIMGTAGEGTTTNPNTNPNTPVIPPMLPNAGNVNDKADKNRAAAFESAVADVRTPEEARAILRQLRESYP